jgi:hypothetical protein
MRYMLLIYADETTEANMSPQEQETYMGRYFAFTEEVRGRGLFDSGDPLHPTHMATSVRIRDGHTLATDGPFAETKEQLGGFYILNCKDLDEAIEMAAKIPAAEHGTIEIRPIVELG